MAMKCGFHSVEISQLNATFLVPTRYQNLTLIGAGTFGTVVAADDTHPNAKCKRVAIKKIKNAFETEVHAKRAYREMHLLHVMDHENIIKLTDAFTPTSFEDFQDIYLVTELMAADLSALIKSQIVENDHIKFLVYQILRGLKYLHSGGIMHRDLKPSNIAINEDCSLKILDFGLSRQINVEVDHTLTAYVTTRWYRAPEVMLNWMHYSQNIDVWSVGCIMAELLSRRPLFKGDNQIEHLKEIMRILGTPNDDVLRNITSEDAQRFIASLPRMVRQDLRTIVGNHDPLALDLLERMLDINPMTRICVDDALAHPYLQMYADVDDEPTFSAPECDSYEHVAMDIVAWRRLLYDEIIAINKEASADTSQHPDGESMDINTAGV